MLTNHCFCLTGPLLCSNSEWEDCHIPARPQHRAACGDACACAQNAPWWNVAIERCRKARPWEAHLQLAQPWVDGHWASYMAHYSTFCRGEMFGTSPLVWFSALNSMRYLAYSWFTGSMTFPVEECTIRGLPTSVRCWTLLFVIVFFPLLGSSL